MSEPRGRRGDTDVLSQLRQESWRETGQALCIVQEAVVRVPEKHIVAAVAGDEYRHRIPRRSRQGQHTECGPASKRLREGGDQITPFVPSGFGLEDGKRDADLRCAEPGIGRLVLRFVWCGEGVGGDVRSDRAEG